MTEPLALAWAGRSDVGSRREQNEDAFWGEAAPGGGPPRGLFIVCDGMGGHARGEEASARAVEVLRRELSWALGAEPWPDAAALTRRVQDAVLTANAAIFEWNEQSGGSGRERGGTTLAMLLLAGRQACVVHVGDSRVYRLHGAGLTQVTADHSVANREIAHGEAPAAARKRADARHLTQALGPRPADAVRPDVRLLELDRDSLFLLCTDGLSDGGFVERAADSLLAPLLAAGADLGAGCAALVSEGNRANGHDNLTGVVVRLSGLGTSARAVKTPTTERVAPTPGTAGAPSPTPGPAPAAAPRRRWSRRFFGR
jgi:protein phosphatase